MYSVSSGFISTAGQANAPWKRKFTMGGSDYTSRVMKWPKINTAWNDLKPGTCTIELTNDDRLFSFFISDPTKIKSSATVQLGFDYAISSTEYLTLFEGKVDAVQMREGSCKITFADKFKQLSDRIVGDSTTPIDYTGSSYLVHDMAWYLCTSHGGLSATVTSANPDIDWTSFNSWTSIWSGDNVRVKALFNGKKITEGLRRIAEMTQSAIRVENNKIKFSRYTVADSITATLNASTVMDADMTIDERAIINRVKVSANFNVTSKSFAITVVQANSASVNSYSLKEEIYDDDQIWFVDSVSALNLAQRVLTTYDEPFGKINVLSALNGAMVTVGDTITFVDTFYGFDQAYRIMEQSIDMDQGTKSYVIDDTQLLSSFRLDFSALDSSDILS